MYRPPDPRSGPNHQSRSGTAADRKETSARSGLGVIFVGIPIVGLAIYLAAYPLAGVVIGTVGLVLATFFVVPLAVASTTAVNRPRAGRSNAHDVGAGQADGLTPPRGER
jgi:hypothetical protein